MKLHHALIVATLSLSVLAGDTYAQDRMFGNGRFLKKMRDDIFGSKPDPKTPAYGSKATATSKKGFSLTGKGNVPTPALPSEGSRPTAMDSKSAYKYQAPQTRPLPSPGVKSLNSTTQDQPALASSKVSKKVQAMDSVTRSAKKQTLAFGMLLQTRGQDLVVTQLDPAGNAQKSGVRKGDLILGAGGVELGSMLEFNEITDVLKSGDQLEFVVSHGGKKDKKLILFGEAPDMTPKEVVQTQTGSGSQANSDLNQYELAPANTSMHSVIEGSGVNRSASQKSLYQQQNWKYNSQRRSSGQQIKAIEAASVRGETILNVPN